MAPFETQMQNTNTNTQFNSTLIAKALLSVLLLMCACVSPVSADDPAIKDKDPLGINNIPRATQGTGVEPNIGTMIDPDIHFHDHDNRFVKIGDYFGDKPLMLSFNYSNCPKLCSVQLENMVKSLGQIKFKVGVDFDMVSVSIDPLEQTSKAREQKDKYVHMYNQGESVDGFHFLTGEEEAIDYLADLCGFKYKYVPSQKLYSHPPVFILVAPDGKIVRYIPGLNYEPDTIEKALIETSEGKIGGSAFDWASYALGCFVYDESRGKYTFEAMAIMRIGGLLTVVGLIVGLVPYWFFRKGRPDDIQAKPENTNFDTDHDILLSPTSE
jgi:protein SCO1/2